MKKHSLELTRRQLVRNASAAALSMWVVGTPLSALSKVVAPNAELSASPELFEHVAVELCGQVDISSALSRKAYETLVDLMPGFDLQLARLATWLHQHKLCAESESCQGMEAPQDLQHFMQTILLALYTGCAGTGANTRLVAYEQALMYAQTRHVTTIPSYSPAGYGHWATPVAG